MKQLYSGEAMFYVKKKIKEKNGVFVGIYQTHDIQIGRTYPHPDISITVMVGWALKINHLSIYPMYPVDYHGR